MAARPTTTETKIPWHLLKAWVSQQQAYESSTSQLAPITPQQEKALLSLLRSIEPTRETPSIDLTDLTETNWIGDLQEYLQRSGQSLPSRAYDFEPDPTVLPGNPPQFRCFVTIPGYPQPFPPGPPFPENGTGDEILSFPRKDLAKKYAAKCAFTYLTGQYRAIRTEATNRAVAAASAPTQTYLGQNIAGTSLTSRDHDHRTATANVEPRGEDGAQQRPVKLQRTQPPEATIHPSPATTTIPGLSILQPQGNSTVSSSGSSRNSDKKEETYVARLASLCAEKGIESPKYVVTPSATGRTRAGAFFNGYPVFRTATLKLPDGLGHVQDVLGQKEAKERIAEAVFAYMDEEHRKHLEAVDKFMNDLPQ